MPKYSDSVTFVVESPWRVEVARHVGSVGRYFTSAGEFVEEALAAELRQHVAGKARDAATAAGGAKKTQ
jgi:hypothetical protein